MTLSPVFRSPAAVRLLREEGIWEGLSPSISGQADAVTVIRNDVRELVDERFLTDDHPPPAPGDTESEHALEFLQEYFFLILFRSLFESLGVSDERLRYYSELNFCVKGTITAADNLFDDQAKSLLPLRDETGPRFLSILQLMAFERLMRRAGDRAVSRGVITAEQRDRVARGLIDLMAEIGELEGSEEGGVEEIPPPDEMVRAVHRVRGGALFALSFVAPRILEEGATAAVLSRAEPSIARLGTAFQIVDDLTDFEFDLSRRSHNLLVSEIRHHGSEEERAALDRLWNGGSAPDGGMVEGVFRRSARVVLERAYDEARTSFRELGDLGFWIPPSLADEIVRAIVGMDGVARMETLSAGAGED
jgi:hypothetical protein